MYSDIKDDSQDNNCISQSMDLISPRKAVQISKVLELIDDHFEKPDPQCNFTNSDTSINNIKTVDRTTSPIFNFSMEDFLNNIDSSIDITKLNDGDVIEEVINNGQSKNINCNTYYSNDVLLLNNAVNNQDKKKSKEERKKEREKKKEEDLFKKYQIEQEAKHKAIARSKCGRWVKFNIKIGEGGYKFVYRGYDVVDAKNVAWCEFKRDHVDTKEKRLVMFKETEIMLKMNHSHIVRCFDVLKEWHILEDQQTSIDEKGIVIIQELMGEGTLKNIIKKNFIDGQCILKFPLITRWWHQILDALRYMHQNLNPPIIHRDLKADNCFLYGQTDDEYLNVKVGDFGLATHVHTSGRKTMLGTLGFMAPEIFDEKYDESVDIYAFGMLMLEVMTNRTPYDECETIVQVAAKTLTGKGPKVLEKVGDKWLREIINSCIHPLACYRPTAEELYFHPIFQCKSLRVEVELNYDKVSDRTEVIDRFISNILICTKVNLRLRFRDKRMLQELGLDDGESLEFDLDIYKAEDQDIPELIQNLRLEYEDKLSRVYDNPKIQDKRTISSNLDKLFLSLELQMKCLVKHLLGRRWRDILDSLVAQKTTKTGDGEFESGDDQDEDNMNSFTMISKYKGMWTKAKRLLDKEIQNYREHSSKESNIISPTKQVDIKSSLSQVDEAVYQKMENIENEPVSLLKPQSENDTIENATLFQGNVTNQFQVLPPITNVNTVEIHDSLRDLLNVETQDPKSTKSIDTIESESSLKDSLVHKLTAYNIRIESLENDNINVNVTFVVEIPDFSKSEGGKWVLSFRCVINEFSNLDSFEANGSGIFIDKVDNEINSILQETVQCILKIIQINRNYIKIDQNYVFYPKEQNLILLDLFPKVLATSRIEVSNSRGLSDYFHDAHIESEGYGSAETAEAIMSNISESVSNFENMSRSNTGNSQIISNVQSNDLVNEKIRNYIESLFESDSSILLIKKIENEERQIIKAHSLPAGMAFVVNSDLAIQQIKKTTIISPKVELNGNVFVRELDKSDLSMDKAINILSLLQEKIEDLSSKEFTKNVPSELNSKVLFDIKLCKNPNIDDSNAENFIDKQKIIEQVLKQKKEIEKLQWQQSQFIALLENNAKLLPSSDHDILNQQKINNKLYLNQMHNPSFNTDPGYLCPFQSVINQNQVVYNNNDPRLLIPNNANKNNVYVNLEGYEFQSPNVIVDNSIRPQLHYQMGSMNDSPGLNMTNNICKDFHYVDGGNMRFGPVKEQINSGDIGRMYSEPSNMTYTMDRMDHFDGNLHQIHYHGNEHLPEEMINKINYSSMLSTPDLKNSDGASLKQQQQHQFYQTQPQQQSNYPIYYKVPYPPMYMQQQQQPMQNFYDPSKLVLSYKNSLQHCVDDGTMVAVRKESTPSNHLLCDEVHLNSESMVDNQIRADQISFNHFLSNESISSAYRAESYMAQKFPDSNKAMEVAATAQKHTIEDVTKESFIMSATNNNNR